MHQIGRISKKAEKGKYRLCYIEFTIYDIKKWRYSQNFVQQIAVELEKWDSKWFPLKKKS